MRTIKLDVNSLEKAKEQMEIENGTKNQRESKKKVAADRVLRGYDPDFQTPIETKENSPNKTTPGIKATIQRD